MCVLSGLGIAWALKLALTCLDKSIKAASVLHHLVTNVLYGLVDLLCKSFFQNLGFWNSDIGKEVNTSQVLCHKILWSSFPWSIGMCHIISPWSIGSCQGIEETTGCLITHFMASCLSPTVCSPLSSSGLGIRKVRPFN